MHEEARDVQAKGHRADASAAEPRYRVRSDKFGKEAIHKPGALKKD